LLSHCSAYPSYENRTHERCSHLFNIIPYDHWRDGSLTTVQYNRRNIFFILVTALSINPVQTVRLYLFNFLWIVYCLTFSIAREARCGAAWKGPFSKGPLLKGPHMGEALSVHPKFTKWPFSYKVHRLHLRDLAGGEACCCCLCNACL